MGRRIYKRADTGQWDKVDAGFPVIESDTDQGFSDLDAFSDQDIYAVGGQEMYGDMMAINGICVDSHQMSSSAPWFVLRMVMYILVAKVVISGSEERIPGREYMKAVQRYYGMKCVGLRENYGLHQITC